MKTLFTILALCLWVSVASAVTTISFAWSATVGEVVADGYKLCYGTTSGTYTTCVDTNLALTATITSLTDGVTYYFVVRAYNAEGDGLPTPEIVIVATPTVPTRPAMFFSTVTP